VSGLIIMRILLINGNTSQHITERVASEARRVAGPGIDFRAVHADFGARLILTRADNAIAAHAVLTALAKHHSGCDAAVLAVSTDAGLAAARQLSPIPVVGMTEASLLTACMVGGAFGVLVFDRRSAPVFRELVLQHGLDARMTCLHAIEMTPTDFIEPDRVREKVLRAITDVANTGADSVVITGAATAGMAHALQAEAPLPLLDGISCGVFQARLLADMKLPKPKIGSYSSLATHDVVDLDPDLMRLLRAQ
jgi:allantoin racemase